MAFPQYLGIFYKVTINTFLALLETSPSTFLKVEVQEIINIIKSTAYFVLTYLKQIYKTIQVANESNEFIQILVNTRNI